MDKLLNWSLANTNGDEETRKKVGAPDPELLAKLFGGPDEPTLMKQSITIILNDEATLENKEIAFDNFEMLIENLDNANNIENLKLWEPLIQQLSSKEPSFRRYTCSIIGTSVQNNPNSQDAFLKYPGGLEKLISLSLATEEPKDIKLKALYALSSVLRHSELAYTKFNNANGWKILGVLQDNSDEKLKLRVLSLLSSLISTGWDEDKATHIHNNDVVSKIITILQNDTHVSCIDKALNIISQFAANQYKFSKEEVAGLTKSLSHVETLKDQLSEEDLQNLRQVNLQSFE